MNGWYRLPKSGHPFYGPVPEGAALLEEPFAVTEQPSRPARSANKDAWVAWAVANGWSPEDAERATKQALIDELGSVELPEQVVNPSESTEAVNTDDTSVDLAAQAEQVTAAPADSNVGEKHDDSGVGFLGHQDQP